MSDKVIIVTAPDDVNVDGIRVLLVDLYQNQTHLLSQALSQLNNTPTIISYVWKNEESIDWLIDKKHKSDLIIFNADSTNDLITGYMAAQSNSYYFGTLRSLHLVNKSAITAVDHFLEAMEKLIFNHETR